MTENVLGRLWCKWQVEEMLVSGSKAHLEVVDGEELVILVPYEE